MAPFDMVRVSESLGLREIKKGLTTSFNPFVVGSTPAGPTKIWKAPDFTVRRFFGFWCLLFTWF